MFTYQGKTALITGASSGIGAAFARALAARGMNLVLVARSQDKLERLASEVSQQYTIRAEVIPADLGEKQAISLVQHEVAQRDLTIDLLINNAGFATHGYFETIAPERDQEEVMVNVASVVGLVHAFLPAMAARGGSGIINLASTASFQPTPYMPVYGASKAFVLSFSVALAEEYRKQDIRILALCPGATETPFFTVAGKDAAVGRKRTTEQVVETGLRALEKGQSVVVDGKSNALVAQLTRLLPTAVAAHFAGLALHPSTK